MNKTMKLKTPSWDSLAFNQYIKSNVKIEKIISKAFVDLLEIEQMIVDDRMVDFELEFEDLNIYEILQYSSLLAKQIVYHTKYEFEFLDFEFLISKYNEEEMRNTVIKVYKNHFKEDFKNLINDLQEILTFFRRLYLKNRKLKKEIYVILSKLSYVTNTIKHYMQNPSMYYLERKSDYSIREFFTTVQKMMLKSKWRVEFINLSSTRITNLSRHLPISKTKRDQNFILWVLVGSSIGFFVKQLLYDFIHWLGITI